MGLANDYSREEIDETLKNQSQDMGMYLLRHQNICLIFS